MIANLINDYLAGNKTPIDDMMMDLCLDHVRGSLQRNYGTNRTEEGTRNPSPSSSWACGRKIQYDATIGKHGSIPTRSLNAFAFGDFWEARTVMPLLVFT